GRLSYDKVKEHRLYKGSLEQLPDAEAKNLADFALASDSGLRLPLGALTFYYYNKTSSSVDNFWKMVDKKLHENEIELENVDYAKHALKDTNNETQLIRAVTM
ncbi:19467_t:CDS:2, partial [Dentiscutata erythropus]